MTVRLMKAGGVALLPVDLATGTNAQATVTYAPAGAGLYHVITDIVWSYDGAPTDGFLQILDGATVVFNMDITAAGPDQVRFDPPRCGSPNTSMTVLLSAGGLNVDGRLDVGHWIG